MDCLYCYGSYDYWGVAHHEADCPNRLSESELWRQREIKSKARLQTPRGTVGVHDLKTHLKDA